MRKKLCLEKKTKPIHASAADVLHVRIGSLDWSTREASHHLPGYLSHVLGLSTGASPQNVGEITEVNYVPQKSSDYNFECLNSEFGWQGRVYWKHNNFAIHLGFFSW